MEFLSGNSVWVYLFIFFGKIIEVTFATLRIVLINRGERTKGSFVALIEVLLWLFITGTVLVGFQQYPLKAIVFSVAFAIGNWLGSWIESKIALGLSEIKVITSEDPTCLLKTLREHDLAVTVLLAEGKDGHRFMLEIFLKRARINETIKLINGCIDHCMITLSDVKVLKGGYIRK
ncbi:MAG: hypothetical protein EOM87_02010 [Clostridia bacterium]|nr:hypothetical protein [Clostridia bacterium]